MSVFFPGGLPGRSAGELEWLAFEQAGVLTTAQACALLGRARVRSLVTSGRWRHLCHGLLSTGNGLLRHDQQLWVAVLAVGRGALLAGATAAAEAGVRGLRREPLHVLVPAGRRAGRGRLPWLPLDMSGVVVHRTTRLPEEHVQLGRPMRTTTARALVDAASWARTDDQALTIVAAGCQQRRVTPAELRAVVQVLPRAPRRRLVLTALADIEGGAEALSEIDFVRLCRRFGLPAPRSQQRRTDASGRNRYLDAYWPRWRLHVEIDGAYHMDARQWAADLRRQNELWIAGDRVLRFTAWQVRAQPDDVAAQIRAALRAAGWHPGTG